MIVPGRGYSEDETSDRGGQRDPRSKLVRKLHAERKTHTQERGNHADRDRDRDGDGRRRETSEGARADGKDGKPEDRCPLASRGRSMGNTGGSRVRVASLAGPPLARRPAR